MATGAGAAIMAAGVIAVIIMDIGTTIPAATGIGTATTTIGTIRAIMTGTVTVTMVTTTMIDATSA